MATTFGIIWMPNQQFPINSMHKYGKQGVIRIPRIKNVQNWPDLFLVMTKKSRTLRNSLLQGTWIGVQNSPSTSQILQIPGEVFGTSKSPDLRRCFGVQIPPRKVRVPSMSGCIVPSSRAGMPINNPANFQKALASDTRTCLVLFPSCSPALNPARTTNDEVAKNWECLLHKVQIYY